MKPTTKTKSKPEPEMLPPPPKGLHVYSHVDASNAWARILLMGPAKGGKSTAVAIGAPGPVVILNGDGNEDALLNAQAMGAKFHAIDVRSVKEWRLGCSYASELAEKGLARTIVVDTLTLAVDAMLLELRLDQGLEGWPMWNELEDCTMEGMRQLLNAEAHLVVVCHHMLEDEQVGHLPAIPTKRLKKMLPGQLSEWIWFDVDTKANPVRGFQIGPSGNWKGAARRGGTQARRIPADFALLLKELGIKP